MSRPPRETVLTALYNALTASVETTFAADTQAGSVTLANPTTTAGLFLGLPVFGAGIPENAVIATVTPTLTMSLPANVNALQVPLETGFQTVSRRLKRWQDVKAQPALFLRDEDEDLEYQQTILQLQTIHASIWIYSNYGADPDVSPVTALNNLLDAVQVVFAPDDPMQQRFTLGGLVHWCRMSGKIMKASGDLDGQAIAVADVEIIVP